MRANAPVLIRVKRWRPSGDMMTTVAAQRPAYLGRPRSDTSVYAASVASQYTETSRCNCAPARLLGFACLRQSSGSSFGVGQHADQRVATGPYRTLGMLASLQRALGLGDSSNSESLKTHRADILAARSTQASAKLRRLLRRKQKKDAWEYFAQLCEGPDINEFHCSIMLSAATSPQEVQRVVDMAGRAGVQPNAAVYV